MFKIAAENSELDIESLNPHYTYMFELISPYNRVVVPHTDTALYHIGTRNNVSLKEIEIDIGVKKPKTYDCSSLSDLIEMASKLCYCEEGYVVKDKDYRRIKVKSPAYIAAHHIISGMNEKRLIELLRTNEAGEFLTYFPEYKKYIDALSEKIKNFESYVNDYLQNNIIGVKVEARKDFAMLVTKSKYPAFFFNYFDGKVKEPLEWLWLMHNDKILELLI